MKGLAKRERRREEELPEENIGNQLRYGNLLNNLVGIIVDAVSASRKEMKRDLEELYGKDIMALAMYSENPTILWRISMLVARDIILSRHAGKEDIEYSGITKAYVAMAIAGNARKPGLKLPSITSSDIDRY